MKLSTNGDIIRPSGRRYDELRKVTFEPKFLRQAEGSCLVCFGNTRVVCTASIEERVPHFIRNSGKGWITAEYGMLPRSTHSRINREASKGKQTGRTLEIQRLIGRSLRSVVDLSILGERQIIIDCDVLEADGGTRTASISGAWVALSCSIKKLLSLGKIKSNPISEQVSAISCGIWKGYPILDLDYTEDSTADADANFVLTSKGNIVELQATAETNPFEREDFNKLLDLASLGTKHLFEMQIEALDRA